MTDNTQGVNLSNKLTMFMVILVVVLGAVCLHLNTKVNTANRENESNVEAANSSIRIYKDKYNRTVAEKKSYVVDSKKKISNLSDSLKVLISKFNDVESVIEWKTKIEYRDTIHIQYDTIIAHVFVVPFKYHSEWLYLDGLSTNEGLSLQTILIPNKQSVAVGWERSWFLAQSVAVVNIVNTNPNVSVSGVKSFIVKPEKRFIDKWYVQIGIGVAGGLLIAK